MSVTEAPRTELDFHAQWVAELDRLEVNVQLAEAMLAANEPTLVDLPPWQPPAMRGPLPSDLEPRARLVLERQLAVAHVLAQRLTTTDRQRALTARIRENAQVDIPVYIDISA